jgi:ATP adenylyltransferase
MDRLWTPWRYAYLTKSGRVEPCIFCTKAAEKEDAENLIVHRGKLNFVILNRYPYNSGHLMVAPYAHVPTLEAAPVDALGEMMRLVRQAQIILGLTYQPDGFNMGMNIGASAGAGVAGHIHMHVVPRWNGDANFMSTIGETRILPEELSTTYEKLSKAANWPAGI